jgi:hypothetical protein
MEFDSYLKPRLKNKISRESKERHIKLMFKYVLA